VATQPRASSNPTPQAANHTFGFRVMRSVIVKS
jgi:hypothetical protein